MRKGLSSGGRRGGSHKGGKRKAKQAHKTAKRQAKSTSYAHELVNNRIANGSVLPVLRYLKSFREKIFLAEEYARFARTHGHLPLRAYFLLVDAASHAGRAADAALDAAILIQGTFPSTEGRLSDTKAYPPVSEATLSLSEAYHSMSEATLSGCEAYPSVCEVTLSGSEAYPSVSEATLSTTEACLSVNEATISATEACLPAAEGCQSAAEACQSAAGRYASPIPFPVPPEQSQ